MGAWQIQNVIVQRCIYPRSAHDHQCWRLAGNLIYGAVWLQNWPSFQHSSQVSPWSLLVQSPLIHQSLGTSKHCKYILDLAFNNVKPKDWYFVLDEVQFRTGLGLGLAQLDVKLTQLWHSHMAHVIFWTFVYGTDFRMGLGLGGLDLGLELENLFGDSLHKTGSTNLKASLVSFYSWLGNISAKSTCKHVNCGLWTLKTNTKETFDVIIKVSKYDSVNMKCLYVCLFLLNKRPDHWLSLFVSRWKATFSIYKRVDLP